MKPPYDAKLHNLRDEIDWGPNVEHPTIMAVARRIADLYQKCPRNCLASPVPGCLKVHNEELWEPCQCGGTGVVPSVLHRKMAKGMKYSIPFDRLVRYLFGEDGC